MKLRNLMYATMIACAFASCSKDEVPTPDGGGENEKGNATLSMKVLTTEATKAAEDNEATIHSLTAYIFDATNTLEKKVVFDATQVTAKEVEDVVLSAGPKTLFVLANQSPEIANLAAAASATALSLTAEGENNGYTMNSKNYSFTIIANTHHYLGYTDAQVTGKTSELAKVNVTEGSTKTPVQLYRNVAKISLAKVSLAANAQYGSTANIEIDGVFLLHVHGNAAVYSKDGAEWGSTEVAANWLNGVENTEYTGWVTALEGVSADKLIKKYLPSGTTYTYASSLNKSPNAAVAVAQNGNTTTFIDKYCFAYENTDADYHTLLVVAARMGYGTLNVENAPVRYYPVSIGRQGLSASDNVVGSTVDGKFVATGQKLNGITRNELGVLRNMQYNLSLTIKGLGYETPFGPEDEDGKYNGLLDILCEVVPFGQVSQDVEI